MPPLEPSPFPATIRTVGLFAPAGRLPDAAVLAPGIRLLQSWGLTVVEAPHVRSSHRELAGTDAERRADLEALLRDPRVDALIAVRGGFGCARLLAEFDPALFAAYPKPLLGYSDLTALHLARFNAGVHSGLAGPMAAVEFARCATGEIPPPAARFCLDSLRRAWAPQATLLLPPETRLETLRPGTAAGPLLPANLTVLCSLLGTPLAPRLAGAILVLEDIKEDVYRLDRCLTQLRLAGALDGLAGLVFADFSGTDEPAWLAALQEETAAHLRVPVIRGLPWGHCQPLLTLPVGPAARLHAPATTTAPTLAVGATSP